MMNVKLIEKLEHTTPACASCHGTTHFITGTAYSTLKCDNCGQPVDRPYLPHPHHNRRVQSSSKKILSKNASSRVYCKYEA